MLSPSIRRYASWLALPVALAGAVLAARMHLSRVATDGVVPPADPAELRGWLSERAPPVDSPALASGVWPGLAGQPALAIWARARLSPGDLSPAIARGLAVHAIPGRVLRSLGPRSGLDAESLALLMDPPLADRVADACPRLEPRVRTTLCGGRARAESARDAALAQALASPDADVALWAVELASGLGEDGARLAETASRQASVGTQGDRTRGHALVVLARTLPPAAAVARLERHTGGDDPLAPLAILELSRLPGGGAALQTLATSSPDPGLAALAAVAHGRATGRPAASGEGLLGRGL